MYWLTALALLVAQEVRAAPAVAERSTIQVSDKTLALTWVNATAPSSLALLEIVAAGSTIPLKSAGGGYGVATNLGGSTFNLLLDTGSSDLWVAQKGIQCLNSNGKPAGSKTCDFGSEFSGKYTGGSIKNKNFYITYGSGEVFGSLGYESVTLAGVNVAKQEISSAIKAYFPAEGLSGIFGFAYSDITNQYNGRPGKTDKQSADEPYVNWIGNAIAQKKISPLFTVVLERGRGASSLTLGGIPSAYSGLKYTSTPIEIKNLEGFKGSSTQYTFYTITPKGISVEGQTLSTSTPAIVDTGTTLLYLPAAQAAAVNSAFFPPAEPNALLGGLYATLCAASVPKFGVNIAGTTFNISPQDLLFEAGEGLCVSGVQSSGTAGFGILGDVFLKNVVAVFNRGSEQMQFAAHSY